MQFIKIVITLVAGAVAINRSAAAATVAAAAATTKAASDAPTQTLSLLALAGVAASVIHLCPS